MATIRESIANASQASPLDWETFASNCAEHGLINYMKKDPKKMKKKTWAVFVLLDEGVDAMIGYEKSEFTIPHIIEFLTKTGKFPNSKLTDEGEGSFLISDMDCWRNANHIADLLDFKIKNRQTLFAVVNLSEKTGFPIGKAIGATRCWDDELGLTE
jgi:hypothetical protein